MVDLYLRFRPCVETGDKLVPDRVWSLTANKNKE